MYSYPTGMAGNTELDNAVLGGSADYIGNFAAIMSKTYFATKDDEKECVCVRSSLQIHLSSIYKVKMIIIKHLCAIYPSL